LCVRFCHKHVFHYLFQFWSKRNWLPWKPFLISLTVLRNYFFPSLLEVKWIIEKFHCGSTYLLRSLLQLLTTERTYHHRLNEQADYEIIYMSCVESVKLFVKGAVSLGYPEWQSDMVFTISLLLTNAVGQDCAWQSYRVSAGEIFSLFLMDVLLLWTNNHRQRRIHKKLTQ
jgi:hypothetical protein